MASQDDVLQLIAKLDNQTSKGFKDMQKDLRDYYEAEGKAHKASQASLKQQNAAFSQMTNAVTQTGHAMSGILSPAMTKLGLEGISVAGAIAMVASSVKSFVNQTVEISRISNITGIDADKLKLASEQYERMGGSAAEYFAKMKAFNRDMLEYEVHGGTYQQLAAKGWGELAEKILNTKGETAKLKVITDAFFDSTGLSQEQFHKNQVLMAEMFPFLDVAIGRTHAQYDQFMKDAIKGHVKLTEAQQKLAQEGEMAWARIGAAIERVKNQLGIDVVKSMHSSAYGIVKDSPIYNVIRAVVGPKAAEELTVEDPDLPQHATGGHVTRDHVAKVHAGEDIIPLGQQKSTGDAINIIALGTRKGVFDGLWDYYSSKMDAKGGGNASPGEDPASAAPGAGSKLNASPMGKLPGIEESTGPQNQSGDLAKERANLKKEWDSNPALRTKIHSIIQGENPEDGGQDLIEAMTNRAIMRHTTLAAQAKFVGEKGGYYAAHPSRQTKAQYAATEGAADRVFKGSNITNLSTDEASGVWGHNRMDNQKFQLRHTTRNHEYYGRPVGAYGPKQLAEWERMNARHEKFVKGELTRKADEQKAQQAAKIQHDLHVHLEPGMTIGSKIKNDSNVDVTTTTKKYPHVNDYGA